MTGRLPVEHFPALDALAVCRSAFITRIPGIDVRAEKAQVLDRLETAHREVRDALGMQTWPLITGEQVHGNEIKLIDTPVRHDENFPGFDGFVTKLPEVTLGIYVADCCAVYIVDPKTPAIGIVHSGKKGTELKIASAAIERMAREFGSEPANLVVQLSPCIRPPHYEVDFAGQIQEQCRAAGVRQIHDCGTCTGCDLDTYYSYRLEKGKTGRMLALLGLV